MYRGIPCVLVVLVVGVAVLGTSPVASGEVCAWRWRVEPKQDLGPGPPPLVIGDSIMGYSVRGLGRAGFRADARMCREWRHGREMIERLHRRGKLPQRVAIALGSNADVPLEEIKRVVRLLDGGHKLAIVTPRESGGKVGPDAETVRRAGERWPRKIEVLDWVRHSRGKDWFGGDGVHVRKRYARQYTECIKQALRRYRKPEHGCAPENAAAPPS